VRVTVRDVVSTALRNALRVVAKPVRAPAAALAPAATTAEATCWRAAAHGAQYTYNTTPITMAAAMPSVTHDSAL